MAGVDEAGRGAWAGPVAAGAVILPLELATMRRLRGLTDSKKLNAAERARFATLIRNVAICLAVGWADAIEIDRLGIVPATRLAMRRAIDGLPTPPGGLVIDALRLPEVVVRQDVFFFADAISLSAAAASVLAKTERDARMAAMDDVWPGYGFAAHKGYGTVAHAAALRALGPCPEHRWTFQPVALVVGGAPRRAPQARI
ncbi:MAG: ribonuclease HII [Thermoflexales bacterium]